MSIEVLSRPTDDASYSSSDENLTTSRCSSLLAYRLDDPVYPYSDELDGTKNENSKNGQPKKPPKKKRRTISKKDSQKKSKEVSGKSGRAKQSECKKGDTGKGRIPLSEITRRLQALKARHASRHTSRRFPYSPNR